MLLTFKGKLQCNFKDALFITCLILQQPVLMKSANEPDFNLCHGFTVS